MSDSNYRAAQAAYDNESPETWPTPPRRRRARRTVVMPDGQEFDQTDADDRNPEDES